MMKMIAEIVTRSSTRMTAYSIRLETFAFDFSTTTAMLGIILIQKYINQYISNIFN